MQRPRALVRRTSAYSLSFAVAGSIALTLLAGACASEVEKLPKPRSERDTLGQEVYKVLCRRVAGSEMPSDLDGRKTEALCLGDQETGDAALEAQRAELPPRVVALAERRRAIASALDEVMPDDLGDGLEKLMRDMLPFYDPPKEYLQQGTRAMAAVLRRLAADDKALEGMVRFARDGMTSRDGEFGLFRAAFGYDEIVDTMRKVLPALTADGEAAAPAFVAALEGMALELATAEPETEPDSDTCRLRELLQRTEPATASEEKRFASGAKLFSVARDVRGMPVPKRPGGETGADLASACGDGSAAPAPVPFPFVDEDADGFADIEGGRFVAAADFEGTLPEPFPVPFERDVVRDQHGRAAAINADSKPDARNQLYVTDDVDPTLLAALMRESARLFEGEPSVFTSLAGALPALLGDTRETSRTYEKAKLVYQATDLAKSPLLDLVHASGALLLDPSYDESIELSLLMLREHEPATVASLEPLLALERRTRPDSDAYPEARLEGPNTLWDEMLFEFEKLSRRRRAKNGETLLEAALRSTLGIGRNFDKPDAPMEQLIDPRLLARQGALLAMMLRFKDEWRPNPLSESKRPAGDPAVIGFLKTPVDRSEGAGDTPVTCGKDGCGGPIVGTPFEGWRKPKQNCMVQREGRPNNSFDCGQPSNQSLFHRSMSMLAEMEGRSQCNRPITVADLFEFAGEEGERADPATVLEAEEALQGDYTCAGKSPCNQYANKFPAAFVDLDGAGSGSPSIQECGLIDVKDAGRTFGKVLTHEFVLEIPNPWVRRYLEDIARAADATLPECDPGTIADPTQVPRKGGVACIPQAAKLSRDVFDELGRCTASDPACIDTLGELIEFLLDDKSLFATAADSAALKPDPRALSRVMFAPEGSTGGFVLFDPLLVRGAPPLCSAAPRGAPACPEDDSADEPSGCCIKDPLKPPFRYKLDTYYGATTLAWEHSFKLADGSELSFLDAMRPLADAFNRLDIAPGEDPAAYEDARYGLTSLGNIVASHYDSPKSGAQNTDPDAPNYRHLTGVVRYEELLADLLDDGSTDLKQKGPSGEPLFAPDASFTPDQQLGMLGAGVDLLEALDALPFHGGDGISAIARSVESWLNPHAYCAGGSGDRRVRNGKGACDQGGEREPVAYRDGRNYPCWNDGTCFDGKQGRDRRFVSPLYLALDAASEIKRRSDRDPELHKATRGVLSGLLDAFAVIENDHLKYRRLRAVALTMGDYVRERYAEEKAAGKLDDWNTRTTNDVADLLENPALAGGLLTLEKLATNPDALPALSRFLHSLLDDNEHPAQARALLAFAADTLQALPGDESSQALGRAYASGFAKNVNEVLAGEQSVLEIESSATWNSAFVLGENAKADDANVMGRIMKNFARIPGEAPNSAEPLPLSALYDILIDINRADPLQDGPHGVADLSAAFTRIADVMLDERRGFERMYRVVQCATHKVDCD
jgi:hypothetical protein